MTSPQPPPRERTSGYVPEKPSDADSQAITIGTVRVVYCAIGIAVVLMSGVWFIMNRVEDAIRADLLLVRSEVSSLRNDVTSLTGRIGRIEGLLEQRTGTTRTGSAFGRNLHRTNRNLH